MVGNFVGAQGEQAVREFVAKLLPDDELDEFDDLLAIGDEGSLRSVLDDKPDHQKAVCALAKLLVERDEGNDRNEAVSLLSRVPETAETRRIAAISRVDEVNDLEGQLAGLLERVRNDDEARQRYLDLLEVMGPEDPLTAVWRQQLTSLLF